MRTPSPPQKRRIDNISQDSESETDLPPENLQAPDYFLEEPLLLETNSLHDESDMHGSSTAAAVEAPPNADQDPKVELHGVVVDYLKTCLNTFVDYYLRQYRSSRYELRRRSVSLTVLQNHFYRATLPRDLDFKLGPANPYRNIHANRDELLNREQQIIQEAKSKILQYRIEAATSAVHEQEQMIATTFSVEDVRAFTTYCQDKFKPLLPLNLAQSSIQLINDLFKEYRGLYRIKLAEQKKTLDDKFAALDAKHADNLKTTAKTVSLVQALTETDFQSKLLQALKGLVEEHTMRPRKKPTEPSPAPAPTSPPQPAADSGKKKRTNRRKSQKMQTPSSETPEQTKPDSTKRRSYSDVISSVPPSAPPAAPPLSTRSSSTSSSSHRHVTFDRDNTSVDENDETWTPARRNKNRRTGKNAQAQDNRNVPKQTSR